MSIECKIDVAYKKLHPDVELPTKATGGSGGYDIKAIDDGEQVRPDTRKYRTGLAISPPYPFGAFLLSRSGHGAKKAMRLSNSVGLVDPDYRGEVTIFITQDTPGEWPKKGDRIAQVVFMPTWDVDFFEMDELDETVRGEGGFGHSGD